MKSILEQLARSNTPCLDAENCNNSPKGEDPGKCLSCKWSPVNDLLGTNYWWPINKKIKNRTIVELARQTKKERTISKLISKANKNHSIQKRNVKASIAEKETERSIIKATKNSGRSNKDGDHVYQNDITLDTKLQSKRSNPVVNLHELDNVRQDAKRSNHVLGALVLRNKNGRGVVVMAEEDFARWNSQKI